MNCSQIPASARRSEAQGTEQHARCGSVGETSQVHAQVEILTNVMLRYTSGMLYSSYIRSTGPILVVVVLAPAVADDFRCLVLGGHLAIEAVIVLHCRLLG